MSSGIDGHRNDMNIHEMRSGPEAVRLSICIATYSRAAFIGQTIEGILAQLQPGVEVIIVDGASPDDTESVVANYLTCGAQLRYFKENVNSGIDGDYDKAVGYASGEYCWLMTDDDLLKPGAVETVLNSISQGHDLVVLNSEVWNADYSALLTSRFAPVEGDKKYQDDDIDRMFVDTAGALSFIGCVVIRRSLWLSRSRIPYYGTLFVHFGVIFQQPLLRSILLIADPLISIRYGNAMWSPRGFEIWMFKWPELIWSFTHIDAKSRLAVSRREPWREFRKLLLYRAIGGYGMAEYQRFLRGRMSGFGRVVPRLVAAMPGRLANGLASVYCMLFARRARLNVYDLARSANSSWISHAVARVLGIGWR